MFFSFETEINSLTEIVRMEETILIEEGTTEILFGNFII